MSEPTLPVTVLLDEAVHRGWSARTRDAVSRTVADAHRDVLRALGLPGEPSVTTAGAADPWRGAASPGPGLIVEGRRCRAPHGALAEAVEHVSGSEAADAASVLRDGQAPEVLSRWCASILDRQPAVLVGDATATAYGARLPSGSRTVPLKTLRFLVAHRLSLAAVEPARQVLAETDGRPEPHVAERLFTALAPARIDLRLHPDLLRTLTIDGDPQYRDLLPTVRRQLFDDTGVTAPDFRLVADDALPQDCWQIVVNHLPMPPERVGGSPPVAAFPALGQSLAAALRAHAASLVHLRSVNDLLELASTICPKAVLGVSDAYPPERLTGLFRTLAADGVSFHNLPALLERLGECHVGLGPPGRGLVAAARAAVAWTTSASLAVDDALAVYEMTGQGVTELAAVREQWEPWLAPVGAAADVVVEAFERFLTTSPKGGPKAVVLTDEQPRAAVADVLRYAAPGVRVLAHDEVAPTVRLIRAGGFEG